MAPRPHTSPSTSSPPNGSRDHPSGLTGTTSVWPIRHSAGASGSLPSMRATIDVRPGTAVEPGDVEPGALEVRLQQVGVAHLVAGLGRAVVDALVADQRLQQLGGRTGERLGSGHGVDRTDLRSGHEQHRRPRGPAPDGPARRPARRVRGGSRAGGAPGAAGARRRHGGQRPGPVRRGVAAVTALGQHAGDDPDGGVDLDRVDTADGEKIVGHVFGDNEGAVVNQLGGLGGGGARCSVKLLPLLAPLVMGFLAKNVLRRRRQGQRRRRRRGRWRPRRPPRWAARGRRWRRRHRRPPRWPARRRPQVGAPRLPGGNVASTWTRSRPDRAVVRIPPRLGARWRSRRSSRTARISSP